MHWSPSNARRIQEVIHDVERSTDRPVATFDWDNTCMAGDISELMLSVLSTDQERDLLREYEALFETHGRERAYAFCCEVHASNTAAHIEHRAAAALQQALQQDRVQIRAPMRDLCHELTARGWEVWIVSASLVHLVRAAARTFGVPRDRILGVQLEESDGLLAPRVREPMTMYEGKVLAIRHHIGKRPDLAAGDSPNDLPMLRYARHAIVIDRAIDEMRAESSREDWILQSGWPARSWEPHRGND